jgi:hypothetical protein
MRTAVVRAHLPVPQCSKKEHCPTKGTGHPIALKSRDTSSDTLDSCSDAVQTADRCRAPWWTGRTDYLALTSQR